MCTFVDIENSFEENGVLDTVKLYLKYRGNRRLGIGIFTPTTESCLYILKDVIYIEDLTTGYNEVIIVLDILK